MNITQFKTDLCELIDDAYEAAMHEGSNEILYPFMLTLNLKTGQLDYHIVNDVPARALERV
jgi:hypothetical protein